MKNDPTRDWQGHCLRQSRSAHFVGLKDGLSAVSVVLGLNVPDPDDTASWTGATGKKDPTGHFVGFGRMSGGKVLSGSVCGQRHLNVSSHGFGSV